MENEEKRIKRELNNVGVHADPNFKQQSYQKTLEALRESKQAKPRRSNKSRYAKAGAGLIAAAAIGGLLVISNPELTNLFTSNGENGGTQQTTDDVAIEDLPQYIDVEQGDDTMTFELYDEPELPFVTYLPEDFESDYLPLDDENADLVASYNYTINASDFISVGIMYYYDSKPEDQLSNEMRLSLMGDETTSNSEYFTEDNASWFVKSFRNEEDQSKLEESVVGKMGEDTFIIAGAFNSDAEGKWKVIQSTIIQKWRWRDTGEKLIN